MESDAGDGASAATGGTTNSPAAAPSFCQVEAAETAIWLMEVVPTLGRRTQSFFDHLQAANDQANPGLDRLALRLATHAGETMTAMLIS